MPKEVTWFLVDSLCLSINLFGVLVLLFWLWVNFSSLLVRTSLFFCIMIQEWASKEEDHLVAKKEDTIGKVNRGNKYDSLSTLTSILKSFPNCLNLDTYTFVITPMFSPLFFLSYHTLGYTQAYIKFIIFPTLL